MRLAFGILTHTPIWVFALLAYLVWQGIVALRPRTVAVWRVLIVPSVFIVWGLSRIVLADQAAWWPTLVWLAAAASLAPVAFLSAPKLIAVDRSKAQVTRPGSVGPLIRNLVVFSLQYAIAVMAALHVDTTVATIVGRAVAGASTGYFLGWAVALWRRYRAR